MDIRDYKYRSTFTAVARVINPSEQDRFIAKASLDGLRPLLPAGSDPVGNPDLLFFASDGALGGRVNRNGDGITAATAAAIHRTALHKYVSMDHDRSKMAGCIIAPQLTTLGSHAQLTDEEASVATEPFNMSFAGVIWKTIEPMLAKYLQKTGDSLDSEALSMSWEIAFNDYSIAVGSRNLAEARMIGRADNDFNAYDGFLRANKGEGKDNAGQEVHRIIGPDAVILGYSVVPQPAAEVKGILPIGTLIPEEGVDPGRAAQDAKNDAMSDVLAELPEAQRTFFEKHSTDARADFSLCDFTMQDGSVQRGIPAFKGRYVPASLTLSNVVSIAFSHKSEEKTITLSDARVTSNTEPMKIESIAQLEAVVPAEARAAVSDFVNAIKKGSEEYVAKLQQQEDLAKTAEAAKKDAELKNAELVASLASIKTELDALKGQVSATAADQAFQERMQSFDERFDLDDEDRTLIAADIRELDETTFAAYSKKCDKLMASKKKKTKADDSDDTSAMGKKAKPFKKDDDQDDDEDGDDKDKSKAALLIKAALASVTDDGDKKIPNTVTLEDGDLTAAMAAAFGATLKINGKTVNERNAAVKK